MEQTNIITYEGVKYALVKDEVGGGCIKRTGITLNDYPDWVGFGAWVFYWLKMITIAIGAIYGASHFISFAM